MCAQHISMLYLHRIYSRHRAKGNKHVHVQDHGDIRAGLELLTEYGSSFILSVHGCKNDKAHEQG